MHQTARILYYITGIYNHIVPKTQRFGLNVFSDSTQCRMCVVGHMYAIIRVTPGEMSTHVYIYEYELHNAARDCGGILHRTE